jgi:hypothetical protein
VNEQTAKVKIDAIQEIVKAIARAEAEKVMDSLDHRLAVVEADFRGENIRPSIPEPEAEKPTTPRDLQGMSVDDCRIEVGPPSVPGYAVPNTPEEMRKLPEGWRLESICHDTRTTWEAMALPTKKHPRFFSICAYAPDRDLAEWRLRVACERASK